MEKAGAGSTQFSAPLLRGNTKIVVLPVDHFTGSRLSRRTWSAQVVLLDDETVVKECGHWAHPTTAAATACARKMWNRLPVEAR